MFDEYPDILTVQDIMRALDIGRNKAYDMLKHNQIKNIKMHIHIHQKRHADE